MAAGLVSIDIGKLAKPATVLIERVSDAVGGIAKPWQIPRVAKAEAKANLIVTQSGIEMTELQMRAANRWMEEETKNQFNIESITHQAIPHLNDDSEPEKIEDDSLRNFFDKCRIVSNEQMQDIWARILAGEANNPGSISRKTINILGDMDNADAELFTMLSRFAWRIGATPIAPIFDSDLAEDQSLYSDAGINLAVLANIEAFGLIHTSPLGFHLRVQPTTFVLSYFANAAEITMPDTAPHGLTVGNVFLTASGSQVVSICERTPVEGFFEFICTKWSESDGVESVTILHQQGAEAAAS